MSDNEEEEGVYCICRSTDTSRFMIGCDNCNEWYHGDCISITESFAKNIANFVCLLCRTKDPSLKTVYTTDKPSKKKSKPGCGDCSSCLRTQDCGKCEGCIDNRSCKKRICKIERKRKEERREKRRREEEAEAERRRIEEEQKERERKRREKEKKKKEKELELERKKSRYNNDDEYVPPEATRATKRNTRRKAEPVRETAASKRSRRREDDELFTPKQTEPKQCFGPGCVQSARANSKYCSDSCGIKLAMSRIFIVLPTRMVHWNKRESEAELFNKRSVEKLRQQQREAELEELENARQLAAVEELIKKAKQQPIDENCGDDNEDQEPVYCVTCGQDYSQKVIFRHMEKCYNRIETLSSFNSYVKTNHDLSGLFCDFYNPAQQSWCKRLKTLCPEHYKDPKISDTEVCGFPTPKQLFDESEHDFCRKPKKNCTRHVNWEKLKKAVFANNIINARLRKESLQDQERFIRMQMASRGGVLGLMLHETIEHEADKDEDDDEGDDDEDGNMENLTLKNVEVPEVHKKKDIPERELPTAYHGDHDYGFRQ